jgi:hypothetical protein
LIQYLIILLIIAGTARALVMLGPEKISLTTLASAATFLGVRAFEWARWTDSGDWSPFWHWVILAAVLPVVMALIARVLVSTPAGPLLRSVLVFAAGTVTLVVVAVFFARPWAS